MWYLRHCYHPVADKGGGHGIVGRGGDDSALARVAATLAPRRRLQSEPSITRGGFARASPAKVRLLFEERERDSVLAIPPRFQPLFHATPRETRRETIDRLCHQKDEQNTRRKEKKRERNRSALFPTCYDHQTKEGSSEREWTPWSSTIVEHVKKMEKSAAKGYESSRRNIKSKLREKIFAFSRESTKRVEEKTRVVVFETRMRSIATTL